MGEVPGLKAQCEEMAQKVGGVAAVLAGDSAGCWLLYGKTIPIGPDEADIQTGFQITNYNFHTNGNQPALQTQNQLPGPSMPKANMTV
jgi:hypothetical protein